METESLPLEGLLLVKPRIFDDERGFFLENHRLGQLDTFVQDNQSFSKKGVIRGLHYQKGQAKLVHVIAGEIYDVVVDIREGSPTYGQWHGVRLSGDNHWQLYVPDGFAHGFCAISDAHVCYKVSCFYDPQSQGCLHYDQLGIDWPVDAPIVSDRDQMAPLLESV